LELSSEQQHREDADDLDRQHVGDVGATARGDGEDREQAAGRSGEVRRQPVHAGDRRQQQSQQRARDDDEQDEQRRRG
jgi:hypothetical protein